MNVTVVGCGNAGLIHAAKIYQKGFNVGLLKTSNTLHNDFYNKIEKVGGFSVKDETNDETEFWVKPDFITRDTQKAVKFADILFVATTTLQHEDVAKKIANYVRDGQIIILVPGYMGSLVFKKYINKDVVYSEWETTAYNGRIVDDEYVKISFYNPRNAISVLPTTKTKEVLDKLSAIFDNTLYQRENILESALHNPNMIVHTIGVLFSASRIEHSKGEFWMYKEAFTDSVMRVINAFDEEKNNILEKFDCNSLSYFEVAKWRNEEDLSLDSLDVFRSFSESSNKGPSSLFNRYLLEDVPMGLCLFSSIGKSIGVKTPVADSIITLSSALLGLDFWDNARTIDSLLGKSGSNIHSIRKAVSLG